MIIEIKYYIVIKLLVYQRNKVLNGRNKIKEIDFFFLVKELNYLIIVSLNKFDILGFDLFINLIISKSVNIFDRVIKMGSQARSPSPKKRHAQCDIQAPLHQSKTKA